MSETLSEMLARVVPVMNSQRPTVPNPKPEPRKRVKGRKDRAEGKVKKSVRALVAARDSGCRLLGIGADDCAGPLEWAHLEDMRRGRTRGKPPEERHTTADSAMFCRFHHAQYDAFLFTVQPMTDKGANGPLQFDFGKVFYQEPTR